MTRHRLALVFLTLLSTAGCAGLNLSGLSAFGPGGAVVPPPPPRVTVAGVRLAEAPSNRSLAAYFCARELGRRGVPAFVASATCGVLGPVPGAGALRFAFDVELDIENTAHVPLPLLQALVAFHAFPEDRAPASLGAVCVSLCEDAASCPSTGAEACRTDEPLVRDMDDFAAATVNLLVGIARGDRRVTDLRVRTIPAGESVRAIVRLELDADRMLDLLGRVASRAVEQASRGETPVFAIPYALEGSVWARVEGFARIGASFGPVRGSWDLAN